jgi:hypothetical protein
VANSFRIQGQRREAEIERAGMHELGHLPASLEASRSKPASDVSRGRMLAGLRAYERSSFRRVPTPHRFPVRVGPVRCVGFVLTYRCGAAPEFRRVPFSAPGRSQEHQHTPYLGGRHGNVNLHMARRVARFPSMVLSSRQKPCASSLRLRSCTCRWPSSARSRSRELHARAETRPLPS